VAFPSLGRIGIWSSELRYGEPGAQAEAATELDALGFGALWFPGGLGGDVLGPALALLESTRRCTIATGIINIWRTDAREVGTWWRERTLAQKDRLMLGLGVSHGPAIAEYRRPLEAMSRYLDDLDAEGVPVEKRCIAALGPKMNDLARDRSAGSHPYLATPAHTAAARARLGPGPLLAPEQGVIFESDPARAREIARAALAIYLKLPNYVNNWRRLGFSEDDVRGPSDVLIDALFAWGSLDSMVARTQAHFAAGADHVCLQVVRGASRANPSPPLRDWRELAAALLLTEYG
jgi:probable F420-dependent oxidoreductase